MPAVWKSAELSARRSAAALRAQRRELGARIGGERRRARKRPDASSRLLRASPESP